MMKLMKKLLIGVLMAATLIVAPMAMAAQHEQTFTMTTQVNPGITVSLDRNAITFTPTNGGNTNADNPLTVTVDAKVAAGVAVNCYLIGQTMTGPAGTVAISAVSWSAAAPYLAGRFTGSGDLMNILTQTGTGNWSGAISFVLDGGSRSVGTYSSTQTVRAVIP